MKLSRAHIELGKSQRGGLNRAQIELLGGTWPPKDGWLNKVIGKEITLAEFDRFIALTDQLVPRKRPRKERGRSVVKTDLPFPPSCPTKLETVIASCWLFVSRQKEPRFRLMAAELFEYMARKLRQ